VLIFGRGQNLLSHQYRSYADVSLVGESILTRNKTTECLVVSRKEIVLEVKVEKAKHMLK
jgi:hypothetical protein